jgi:hypothetical protein
MNEEIAKKTSSCAKSLELKITRKSAENEIRKENLLGRAVHL